VTAPVLWAAAFSDTSRDLIIGRDTPLGETWPRCVVCGFPVVLTADLYAVHHRRYLSRGGDGRPANGIVVHEHCHMQAIHGDGRTAAAQGWAISRHARRSAYYAPLLCAFRGWIALDDDGGFRLCTATGRDRRGEDGED